MNSNIDGNDKFKDWGDQWFRRKKLDFSLSYAKTAFNHLKNINSFIGDIPISNIKIQDIDEFIIEFAEKNPHTGHPTAKSTLKDMQNSKCSQLHVINIMRSCISPKSQNKKGGRQDLAK